MEHAGALDDLVTLYFSHPAVEGLLLWGFHDDHMNDPGGALFEGDDYTVMVWVLLLEGFL